MHFLETLSSFEIIADHVIVPRVEIKWKTKSYQEKYDLWIVIFEGVYKGGQIIDGIDKW